ncbi:MAG: ATP-binding cassette domain-containing protein [Halieaceae bacterium]|nr:ATP-binding cassette domain-containing protein [Halieaceae bacterium]
MLSFTNLSLRAGTELLFQDVSFTVYETNKIGLVGANGSGKTSLFRAILGDLDSYDGNINYPKDLRIANLAQEVPATEEISLDYVLSGDESLTKVNIAIEDAQKSGNTNLLGDLYAEYETLDGYSAKSKAEKLMIGLGFASTDLKKPVRDFSGGWRVRLNLAQTLMRPSDLVLLDEPTNHLDLDAIIWLVNWIKSYKGAVILISHDREFLDDCADSIAYLDKKSIDLYPGNYSDFETKRAFKLAEIEKNYAKQQREISHIQNFVRRFKAKATKARQAQSRIKALERMEKIAPAHIDSPFKFTINEAEKNSDPLLILDEASIGYSSPVLQDIKIVIRPRDRIGLLGSNGEGKSTLIKSLNGELELITGSKVEGKNLKIGYFSQHQVDDLDLNKSALDHIQFLDREVSEQGIRNFLGGFDFKGNKVTSSVDLFSGGEKARLALAKIVFKKPNLLLMDEPTNHLDIDMRQALTLALQSFSGAIILISHDRHLLANTVDEFMILKDGSLDIFKGDLEDYRRIILGRTALQKKQTRDVKQKKQTVKIEKKEMRQIRAEISKIEKRLERFQRKINEIDQELSSSDAYKKDSVINAQSLLRDKIEISGQIESLEEEWLKLNSKIDG